MANRMKAAKFVNLLNRNGLLEELTSDGREFTVVAPTDSAFDKLPPKIISALSSDPKKLRSLSDYHIIPGFVNTSTLNDDELLQTLSGKEIRYNKQPDSETQTLSGAPIVQEAVHGNIMLITVDNTMFPPQGTIYAVISKSPILKTLADLIRKANLHEQLNQPGSYTIFAPKDEAFRQLDPETINRLRRDQKASKGKEKFALILF